MSQTYPVDFGPRGAHSLTIITKRAVGPVQNGLSEGDAYETK
jgi:hypothetical protein